MAMPQTWRTAVMICVLAAFLVEPPTKAEGTTYCNGCARADLAVSGFTQDQVSWSVNVVVDGDIRNRASLALKSGDFMWLNLYTNNWSYDSGTNATTFYDSHLTSFTSRTGSFPNEVWYLQIFLGMNASIQNMVHSPIYPDQDVQLLLLPSQNYVGKYYIWHEATLNSSSVFGSQVNFGYIYNITAYIFRDPAAVQNLSNLGVSFPLALVFILGFLAIVPGTALVSLVLVQINSVPWRFRRVALLALRLGLLDATFFAVVTGVLFFLPVYLISLRPLLEPIPFTPADESIYILVTGFAVLLVLSLGLHYWSKGYMTGTKRRV